MTDETDLQPRVTAGDAAQRLLDSDDYQTAVLDAQNRVMREWATTEPKEAKRRENLYFEMRALQQVDLSLRLRTEDGQMARSMLGQIRDKLKGLFV